MFLAANGCDVTAIEPERDVVERMLETARSAGLTERVRGLVSDLYTWLPDGPLRAVICTPAAFAGLSAHERTRVIEALQSVTTDGGVHLVETIIAGQSMIDEEELREAVRRLGNLDRARPRRVQDVRCPEGRGVTN